MVAEEWGLQIRVVEGSMEGSKNKDWKSQQGGNSLYYIGSSA
jgi:hypothetical protein